MERALCSRHEIPHGPELGVDAQEGCCRKEKVAEKFSLVFSKCWLWNMRPQVPPYEGAEGHALKGLIHAEDPQSIVPTLPSYSLEKRREIQVNDFLCLLLQANLAKFCVTRAKKKNSFYK